MSAPSAGVWPWVPVLLLGGLLSGLAGMAVIATRDSGFALERDYYRKAVGYDQEIAQRAENVRLGWSTAVDVDTASQAHPTAVEVRVNEGRAPVGGAKVSVEALRNAEASRVLGARLEEVTPGVYRTTLPLRHGGIWELRFVFERNGERMTEIVRREVKGGHP